MDAVSARLDVELLYWVDCPSHERAAAELRAAMAELGVDPGSLIVRQVITADDAQRERFTGSPTIRINGSDIAPTDDPPALTCRLYYRRNRRPSPVPDPDDLRDALRAACRDATR